MISVYSKPANKQKVHSKASVTHILLITAQLSERGSLWESRGCCGETLIPIPHVYEESKVKFCECNVEILYLLFLVY